MSGGCLKKFYRVSLFDQGGHNTPATCPYLFTMVLYYTVMLHVCTDLQTLDKWQQCGGRINQAAKGEPLKMKTQSSNLNFFLYFSYISSPGNSAYSVHGVNPALFLKFCKLLNSYAAQKRWLAISTGRFRNRNFHVSAILADSLQHQLLSQFS